MSPAKKDKKKKRKKKKAITITSDAVKAFATAKSNCNYICSRPITRVIRALVNFPLSLKTFFIL